MSWQTGQSLWRLVDTIHAVGCFDADGEWMSGGEPRIVTDWQEWIVIKPTAAGGWIVRSLQHGYGRKWVPRNTRFVSESKELAKEAAIHKRSYHVRCCEKRLPLAKRRLLALEACDAAR